MTTTTDTVGAVEKCFDLLELLNDLDTPTLGELAAASSLPKSTVHRYVVTLRERGYVVEQDGGYRVGSRALELGGQMRARTRLFRVARPEMMRLAAATGCHVDLVIEENGTGVFLEHLRGVDAVDVGHHVGMRTPLHATATGKAILANLPPERTDEILERNGLPEETIYTITDREELEADLEAIRDLGFAIGDEEYVRGIRSVAAPVDYNESRIGQLNIEGRIETRIGALGVSATTSRLDDEYFEEELSNEVCRASNRIELALEHERS